MPYYNWRRDLGALLFFIGATIVIIGPLPLAAATAVKDYVDALLQAWIVGWNATKLLADPLNLYETPIFYPYPHTLAYTDSLVPQSLLALPLIFATGSVALGNNFALLLSFVLSGFGAYLLVRQWGGNGWGGLAAGLALAFASYKIHQIGHLAMLSTQWFPFTVLFLERGWRKPNARDFTAFGLCFWLQAASSLYYAYFLTVVVAAWVAWHMAAPSRDIMRKRLSYFLLAMAGVALLLLPVAWPYIQLQRDWGFTRSVSEAVIYSAKPVNYLASLSKNPFFSGLFGSSRRVNGEDVLWPGVLATLLAAYSLIRWKDRRVHAFLLSVMLLGLGLSLGPEFNWNGMTVALPSAWAYKFIPGFAWLRAASRWGFLVLLAVSLWGGLGFSFLTQQLARRRWSAYALGMVVLFGLVLEYNASPVKYDHLALPSEAEPIYHWLAQQKDVTAIVELPVERDLQWRQYLTLLHKKPMLDGTSGGTPQNHDVVDGLLSTFPTADAIDLLRALRVNYVIIHSAQFTGPQWATLQSRLASFRGQLLQVAHLEDAYAFELQPAPYSPVSVQPEFLLPGTVPPNASFKSFLVLRHEAPSDSLFSLRGLVQLSAQWTGSSNRLERAETTRAAAPLLLENGVYSVPFELKAPASPGTYRLALTAEGDSPESNSSVFRFQQELSVQVDSTQAKGKLGPGVQLENCAAGGESRAGEYLQLTCFWKVLRAMPSDYGVFVHLLNASGETVVNYNVAPFDGTYATSEWLVGSTVAEELKVHLPKSLPQGHYGLIAGMYSAAAGEPIDIMGPEGTTDRWASVGPGVYVHSAPKPRPSARNATGADFGIGAELDGYDLQPSELGASGTLSLTLYWQTTRRVQKDYTVFVHLVDAAGQMVAQEDSPPRGGEYPTSAWDPGETILDNHVLPLPASLPPGVYRLQIGLYDAATGQRAALTADDSAGLDTLDLVTFTKR